MRARRPAGAAAGPVDAGAGGPEQSTVGGLLWTASGKGAGAFLQILVLAVLARLLAPADFGVVTAAFVVISFFSMLARLGLGHALVQREEIADRHVATAYWASLLIGLLLAGGVWLGAPVFAGLLRVEGAEGVLRALAWLFPLRALLSIAESLLQRRRSFRLMAKIEVAAYALGFGACGIAAALAGAGVWALVVAHYAEAVLATAALLACQPRVRRVVPEYRALRELIGYGGGVTLGKFLNHLALQADNVVVGRWLGAAALGLYGRAYQLMAMPGNLLGEALDRVLFPAMARLQADGERLRGMFLRGVRGVAVAALPSSALAAVLAPELVRLFLGPGWSGVVPPFQVLALGLFFRTSYRISDSLAYATGSVYRRAGRQALYAACVAAGAVAGSRWGITGVAAGVLAALAVNYAAMAQLSLSVLGLGWTSFARAQWPGLCLGALVGGVAWTAATALRALSVPAVLLVPVVAAAAAASALLLVRARADFFLGPDAPWARALAADWLERLGVWRFARRAARPPAAPAPGAAGGPRLAMARHGVTEALVELHVELPREFAPLDRATRRLVRRYLPKKDPAGLGQPCEMARTVSELRWAGGDPEPGIASQDEVEAEYRRASLAAGRTAEQTEERLGDVRRYARALRRGARFPPILLYYDGQTLVQLDGARRMLAHLACGRTWIDTVLVVHAGAAAADPPRSEPRAAAVPAPAAAR